MNAIASPSRRRTIRFSGIAGIALAAICAFHGNSLSSSAAPAMPAAAPAPGNTAARTAQPRQHHWYEIGRASWYGKLFQGHQTASGESFDMNQLTCAHRTLPLGSLVRVTNLRNHRSVVVRVNDRGPMPENRVIDLSYAAAQFLGFSARGTAPVRVELIQPGAQIAQLSYPLNQQR